MYNNNNFLYEDSLNEDLINMNKIEKLEYELKSLLKWTTKERAEGKDPEVQKDFEFIQTNARPLLDDINVLKEINGMTKEEIKAKGMKSANLRRKLSKTVKDYRKFTKLAAYPNERLYQEKILPRTIITTLAAVTSTAAAILHPGLLSVLAAMGLGSAVPLAANFAGINKAHKEVQFKNNFSKNNRVTNKEDFLKESYSYFNY